MKDIIYKEESYKIIGACMEVHNELGCGFLEPVYHEALEIVFNKNGIYYQREKELRIMFCGEFLKKTYNADFVCYDKIILELKALNALLPEHEGQVINYLKTSKLMLGILVNFGCPSLEYKRIPNKYYAG